MRNALALTALLTVARTALAEDASITYPYRFDFKANPLVRHVSSTDPDVHVWDDVVYVYTSQDHPRQPGDTTSYDHMDGYHVFSTTDLQHWTDHGEIMHSRDIAWAQGGWLWAPAAARKDGKFYLYYPIKNKAGRWVIGVAIGDAPTGPFKDIGHSIEGAGGLDPAVFVDDDGQAYIYSNDAKVAKLKPNMIETAEPLRTIDYAPPDVLADKLRRFGEGAYLHKHNGVYYYSYTNQFNKQFQGYYATGKSAYGPFEWKGPMAPKPEGSQYHHSVLEWKGQSYDFYHVAGGAYKTDPRKGSYRITCFDKLFYEPDGSIRMVEPTPPRPPAATATSPARSSTGPAGP